MTDSTTTSTAPLHDDEITVDAELVDALMREQCESWAGVELKCVPSAGTSNWLFRLGEDKVVRLPRRPGSAGQVEKEYEWLPRLAPALPIRVPKPLFLGKPSGAYPLAWSVLEWIEGETPRQASLEASEGMATELGEFVAALQSQDTGGGPPPGKHNSFRGEPLAERDEIVRSCIGQVADQFDSSHLTGLWEQSLQARTHSGPPMWIHGDLLPSNLLVKDDKLQAVIDFGMLGVGDPACELLAAWGLFGPAARAAFLGVIKPDREAWLRGRGWALAFAVIALPYYQPLNHPLADVAKRTLDQVLLDASLESHAK